MAENCDLCSPFKTVLDPLIELLLAMDTELPSFSSSSSQGESGDTDDDIRSDQILALLENDDNRAMDRPGERPFDHALMAFLLALSKLSNPNPRNLCMICKEDMGPNNPRQLCGKTYCTNGAAAPRKRRRNEVDEGIEEGGGGEGVDGEGGDGEDGADANAPMSARRLFVEDEEDAVDAESVE